MSDLEKGEVGMAKTGGAAAKLGNQFEDLWSWLEILRLFEEKITSITFEPIEDPIGIEFICKNSDEHKEYHSIKKRASSHWTDGDISSPKKKTERSILSDLIRKIEKDKTASAHFKSSAKNTALDILPPLFRRYETLSECKAQLSNEEAESYRSICENLNKTEDECFYLFKRLFHEHRSESTLQNELENRFPYYLARKDSSLTHVQELFGILYSIRNDHLGINLTKPKILDLLNRHGYIPANWNLRQNIKDKLRFWNIQFQKLNQEFGALQEKIPRQESKEILQKLQSGQSEVCFLIGAPGFGKSAVLGEFLEHVETESIPFLALRLDQGDAEWERLKRDLGESPEIVLAGIAQGQKAILILDQLDSISRLSGNFPEAYNRFSVLLRNIRQNFPFISIVIGCRKFDFENDPSIKQISDEYKADSIELRELEIPIVDSILKKYKIGLTTPKQKDLLRIPFFLRMFLEGRDPSYKTEYSTPEDIFRVYWDRKQEKLPSSGTNLDGCLSKAIEYLLKSGTYTFNRNLIRERDCLEFLLKENFLTERGTEISFLHPLLQDYAIARKFLKEEQKLHKHLLKLSPEEIFSFGLKSRAILSLIRKENLDRFLPELTDCLFNSKLPFFIKIHLLDWYANIVNPTEDDWVLIRRKLSSNHWIPTNSSVKGTLFLKFIHKTKRRLLQFNPIRYIATTYQKEKTISEIINRIPFGNDSWFELANEHGYWDPKINRSVENFTLQFAYQIRGANLSERKLNVLIPLMRTWSTDPSKQEAIIRMIEFAKIETSESLQNFILDLLKIGFFDSFGGPTKIHSLHYGNLPEKFAILFWAKSLKRSLPITGLHNFFSDDSKVLRKNFPDSYRLKELLKNEHLFYAESFYPILLEIIERSSKTEERNLFVDEVWRHFTYNSDPHRISDIFLESLKASLFSIAKSQPKELLKIIGASYLKKSKTLAYLLFPVFAQNPEQLSSWIYEMILDEPNRLLVGDSGAVGDYIGNYELQGVRSAIRNSWPYFLNEQKKKIQEFIISLNPKRGQYYDFLTLLLLKEIPEADLLTKCKTKLQELERRFPNAELDESINHIMGGIVGSPIPAHALDKMKDRQWIRAMKKYDANYQPRSREILKGNGHQLAQALGRKASEDPNRFIDLLLATQEKIEPFYYGSVLMDISKSWKGQIEVSKVFSFIEKAHSLPGYPCIWEISHLVCDLAKEEIPNSILEMLNQYAAIGKDPWKEPDENNSDQTDPDYLSRGLNSERGSVAWTIGKLVSEDLKRYDIFSKTIEELAVDPSSSVRSCASIPVLYSLNLDRDKAVSLFLEMIDGRDELLTVHYVGDFLGYACHTHYAKLRDTLIRMLEHSNPKIQAIGAKHIFFRSFKSQKAKADVKRIPWETEEVRTSISKLASDLIHYPEYRERCKKTFRKFANDPSKNVRWHLSHGFRNLEDDFFEKEQDWLFQFIRSRTFRDDSHFLLDRLHKLPFVAPKISIALGFSFLQTYLERKEEGYIHIDAMGLDILIRSFNESKNQREKKTLLYLIDCSLLWDRNLLLKMEAEPNRSVA